MLTGTLHTIEATYPRLVEQGEGGSIVIISSMAAVQPMMRTLKGKNLGLLAYCAAKAGVADLGKSYASVLAAHSVRVNWIHPAGVATPMVENPITEAYFVESDPQDLLALVPAMPVQLLHPSDVSALVAWLCSPESRWFTGNGVRLDGGAFLR
jgi:NAD(P)-dependent dehydrogenase (short-subunit alcohol dehydrogenase family)